MNAIKIQKKYAQYKAERTRLSKCAFIIAQKRKAVKLMNDKYIIIKNKEQAEIILDSTILDLKRYLLECNYNIETVVNYSKIITECMRVIKDYEN